jgi:hypothetical protein
MNIREMRKDQTHAAGSTVPAALPLWLVAIVAIGSVLMIVGACLALFRPQMLLSPNQEITPGIHVYAGYLVSRNLALGLMLLVAWSLRARAALSTLMVLYACIQFLDAAADCVEGRWTIVPGILVLGVLFLIGAARVSGHPFWNLKAWRRNGS